MKLIKNTTLALICLGAGMTTTTAQVLTNLHNFAGPPADGTAPNGSLSFFNGALYGTTQSGGTATNGTIFMLATNGSSYSVILNFAAAKFSSGLDADTNFGGANPAGIVVSGSGTIFGAASQLGASTNGTLFSVNNDGSGFAVLKNFSAKSSNGTNSDGARPSATLTLNNGTLYGTTYAGGAYGAGTIFSIGTNGSAFTTLHQFSPINFDSATSAQTNADGYNSLATLVLGGGTLYGSASGGGTNGSGTIFALNTNGSGFNVIKTLEAIVNPYGTNTEGANPAGLLAFDGETLYGTTYTGGPSGNGTIFKVNIDGSGFTVLHSFSSSLGNRTNFDGTLPTYGLVLYGGSLYGAAQNGGAYGYGTLFSIKTNGDDFVVLHNFGSDQANPDSSLLLLGNSLYSLTQSGGTNGLGSVFGFQLPSPVTAYVQVQIGPPTAVAAGAEWQLDGGAFQTNGAVLPVAYGNHLVSFNNVSGYTTPANQIIVVNIAATNLISATYTPQQTGGLEVDISPSEAVTAGARWQVDGGAFQDSGTAVSGLSVGDHTLTFTNIPGWNAPPSQPALVIADQTDVILVTYTQQTGGLGVTITPESAVTAGAQWQVDSGAYLNSGSIVTNLSVGDHTVSYKPLSGWITPAAQVVSITDQTTTNIVATYTNSTGQVGALSVTINPSAAVSAGAQWKVDNGTFQNSGAVVANLGASNHVVSFKATAGWITPSNEIVAVSADLTNDVAFSYTQPDTVKPHLVIATPTPNEVWNSSDFTATGTASDNAGVAAVYVQLNTSAWEPASSANGYTNWTAALTLTPGTNTFRAYALDTSGNNSGTNSVNFIYGLANVLDVKIIGGGTITPNLNGAALQIGTRYTMTAKPAGGYSFGGWSGSLTNKNPALNFVMESNYAFTATFIDTIKPAAVISSPKPNQRTNIATIAASGTVKDNNLITNVYYRLGDGSWSNAFSLNGFTNWTAPLVLTPGLNTVYVYAVDAQGDLSKTSSVSFTYVLSAPIAVFTNGFGTISPNYDNQLLQVSNTYTMTARAGKGFAFTSWTGTLPAPVTTSKLTFTMASNLLFTANFVDITRPVCVVTSPVPNQKWTNAVFVAGGKASDNVGVSNVWYQLNSGGWSNAITTAGSAVWSTPNLTLLSGSNVIQAFAVDGAGNNSLTNSVRFLYLVQAAADWAPGSLNGLLLQAYPAGGIPESIGFDITTFAQSGDNSTNSDDYGAGSYIYQKNSTNTAQLELAYTAPPNVTNNSGGINIVFTNHYAGYFTNGGDHSSGGIVATIASNNLPATITGKTLTAIDAESGQTNIIAFPSAGVFSKVPASGGSGFYTFQRFSPLGGLLTLSYTNGPQLGGTVFVQTTFTNISAGTYFATSFTNIPGNPDVGNGRFNLK